MVCICLLGTDTASSEPARAFEFYFDALPVFWNKVYPEGGETLYCGKSFGRRKSRSINIEHVYPMSWAMRAQGCSSRDQCRSTNRRFNRIESDMHNLYPSRKDINRLRGSFAFDTVRNERREFGKCDFELDRQKRRVEPRPAARGNIARAMLYMMDTYDLKIFRRQGRLLLDWHRDDPPDAEERRRNNIISSIQGNRNRFIDDPDLAKKLRFQ
ncbi:MAG: endonuclease I [Gammaproteobacteria bacterium]|nr:endonuclease I [Gammaproteobacteria bacterium]